MAASGYELPFPGLMPGTKGHLNLENLPFVYDALTNSLNNMTINLNLNRFIFQ